jgi:uncharacterized repeat protein (TIGR03803 family)
MFRMTPSGTLTTLYSFTLANPSGGGSPEGGLVQATNGNLYGTTTAGGTHDRGTVFQMPPDGRQVTFYSLCSATKCAGFSPQAGLVQAYNGDLYGTTYGDYDTSLYGSGGTIFKITPGGTLTSVHEFGFPDGEYPRGGLVQGTDGDLYGTTTSGGVHSDGTVFKITPSGTLVWVYSFCSLADCADGLSPYAPLVEAANGDFYGTTGGSISAGTVFRITPSGTLTTLYTFCTLPNCADGISPYGPLIQATDGNLYGTTAGGGTNGLNPSGGTVFRMTPSGDLTTLYSFCSLPNCADGQYPIGLVQATSGDILGVTDYGGAYDVCPDGTGCGTIFRLSLGLTPFIKSLPAVGKPGAVIKMLGTNLAGATSVTFNGTAAEFTVTSPTLITTTVPTGATTGTIQVSTPSGTLSSNVPFRVLP